MNHAELARLCAAHVADDAGLTRYPLDDCDILILRGSLTLRDWVQDILVLETVHPLFGRVHDGFLAEAQNIVRQMGKFDPGRPVYIAGHSRGGALAVLVGALLEASGVTPAAVVGFGAPRVGTVALSCYMAGVPVTLYQYGADPIPHWPGEPFTDVVPLQRLGRTVGNPLKDHAIELYVRALRGKPQTALASRPPHPVGAHHDDRHSDSWGRLVRLAASPARDGHREADHEPVAAR